MRVFSVFTYNITKLQQIKERIISNDIQTILKNAGITRGFQKMIGIALNSVIDSNKREFN